MLPKSILPGVPLIESPFFDEIAASHDFTEHELKIATDLNQNGFAILPGFFSEIERQAMQIRADLQPVFDDVAPVQAHSNHVPEVKSRIQDAFKVSKTVHEIACDPRMLELLTKLYGRDAFAFQTLNFRYGSQQATHSDAVHFHSVPERFMCGVWAALEDVTPKNGPLSYFSGSHKLPIYEPRQVGFTPSDTVQQTAYEPLWNKLIEKNGFAKSIFQAKAGDALIWSANILHGGEPILREGATRWSQVTHYFFEGCGYYTPMHSDLFEGSVRRRQPADIAAYRRGTQVPKIENRAQSLSFLGKLRAQLSRL